MIILCSRCHEEIRERPIEREGEYFHGFCAESIEREEARDAVTASEE